MDRNVWDPYANWAEVANAQTAEHVRNKITGHKGKWLPNTASEALLSVLHNIISDQAKRGALDVTVVDFGCGLGRNLPLLRGIFPRVVGFDIPEMVQRLRGEQASNPRIHYDAVYEDLGSLLGSERVCVVYDSVVLQHIIGVAYVSDLVNRLVSAGTLVAIVSLSNLSTPVVAHDFLAGDHRWTTVFSEIDTTSFFGNPHQVKVLRRPHQWTLELRDDIIGLTPEVGEWRPVTINGSPARRFADWQVVGLLTDLAPTLLVLFQRPGTHAAWFIDESGRHLGDSVQNLSAATRSTIRHDLRQMLALWLHRRFSGVGFQLSRGLLDLVAPP